MAVVVGDVSQPETSARAVETAVARFGAVNSLILNAGVLAPVDTVANANVDEWRRLFDINFFAVVDLIQHALPELKKSGGNILAVSSGASTSAYTAWGAYGASKAAVNHLIKTVATEEGIGALSVAPGVVDTSMQADIRNTFGERMGANLQKFVDLHANNQLLPPEVPAAVYTNLALRGWSDLLNGGYYRYNAEELKPYQAAD